MRRIAARLHFGGMTTLTRRQVLVSSFYVGGAAALGLGCAGPVASTDTGASGGDAGPGHDGGATLDAGPGIDGGPRDDAATGPAPWVVGGVLLVAGSDGTFDLGPTLPAGTPTGGTFDVDPSGAPLPAGMSLSAAGILSVGTATAAAVDGVVFGYATP